MDTYSMVPNYNLNESVYENSDKSIKIFKSRKKQSIQYIAVKTYTKSNHPDVYTYEYQILKNLTHPSIVRVHGSSEDYNQFCMEMEFCITGDLSKSLWQNKNSQYSEKIIKYMSTNLLLGLQYLHKNGIIHCNLKPSNILIDEYGNIRICDFKKALRVSSMSIADVKKNKSAMTPCYTAPELFSDEGIYSHKTDLWALGCIMYELAIGQVPFFDESVGKLISKIINEEVNFNKKELQRFSDHFIDILRKLLDKDPVTRITWGDVERHSFWELNIPNDKDNKDNQLTKDIDINIEINQVSSRSNSATSIKSGVINVGQAEPVSKFLIKKNSLTDACNIGIKQQQNIVQQLQPATTNKKAVDILRLSKNALQNMMDQRGDEYSEEKKSEVDNADQEFNFQGQENQKVDDADDNNIKPVQGDTGEMNQVIVPSIQNPLEVSVLNVSRVIKRDKRRHMINENEMEKSIFKDDSIPQFETMMIHQSDKIIKPIIGNKLIEIIPQTTYYRNKLPFQPWKIEKIKEVCSSGSMRSFESYLYNIYSLLDQYTTKGDEDNLLNLLNYFETIIQDKEIANNIINTSFMTLFIHFLHKSKNDNIKIRVCSIIAYLVRYSTVIETPLDELGLNTVLIPLVNDRNTEVSKKAIATLGEYLFFVATQAEGEEEQSTHWKISDDSLSAMLFAIDLNRDEVINFYSVKSIENITALTQISKIYFAANDLFISKIIDVYKYTKNLELKASAIYTISHIIRLEPKLAKTFFEKIPLVPDYKTYLDTENPKNQQALINCLLFGISPEYIQGLNIPLSEIFPYLIQHLDFSNSIIKMKIILILSLTFKDAAQISKFGEKLFGIIQKFRKDNNPELHVAIKVFEQYFMASVRTLVKSFLALLSRNQRIGTKNIVDDIVNYLNSFLVIGSYPKIVTSLYIPELLDSLLKMIELQLDEVIVKSSFDILKKFSENTLTVVENSELIIKKLLVPIIKFSLEMKLENKILPLNIAANMITILLDDDKMYSSVVLEEGKTQAINNLIIAIIPLLGEMLQNEETIFASLSFLSLIIERNSAFIRFYQKEGIIDYIFSLMKDVNFYTNLNLIKIIIKFIDSNETAFKDIIEMNLIEKANFLISNDNGDNVMYTEYIIELFYNLMFKINEEKKRKFSSNIEKEEFRKFSTMIGNVAVNFKLCIKLLGSDNINIQEKSCVILIILLQLFPDTYVEPAGVYVKFTSADIPDLLKGLDYNCVKIHKRLIRIFQWIIEFQNDAAVILKPYISYIHTYIDNIFNTSKDPEIAQLANKFINQDLKSLKF